MHPLQPGHLPKRLGCDGMRRLHARLLLHRGLECADAVSRRHARIFADGEGGYYVEDCGSTHGTFVAGARLTEPVRLFDGLRVAFGTSPFELVPTNMMAAVMAASTPYFAR